MTVKRITRKDITEDRRIIIPYCELQRALSFYDRIGYNAGAYGWNYDYYSIGGAAVLTGYRTPGKAASREACEHIENTAAALIRHFDPAIQTWDEYRTKAREELTALILEL